MKWRIVVTSTYPMITFFSINWFSLTDVHFSLQIFWTKEMQCRLMNYMIVETNERGTVPSLNFSCEWAFTSCHKISFRFILFPATRKQFAIFSCQWIRRFHISRTYAWQLTLNLFQTITLCLLIEFSTTFWCLPFVHLRGHCDLIVTFYDCLWKFKIQFYLFK